MAAEKRIIDPLKFAAMHWPKVRFYREEIQMIYSVRDNVETYVVAGNKLGKDFTAAFIILWFFMTRNPCRVVTTSTKDKHLDVLWGEIGQFVQNAERPLSAEQGGPLILNHHHIRKIVGGDACPISYVTGLVASDATAESLQGHHVSVYSPTPHTMFCGDEASSLKDSYHVMGSTWARRLLYLGNPWPCENFFKRAVKGDPTSNDPGGDVRAEGNGHFYRKVIQIRAIDSPNVRHGLLQEEAGLEPDDRVIVPGVKTYAEYKMHRRMWDRIRQQVSLDGEFPDDASIKMFPGEWLDNAEQRAKELEGMKRGGRRCLGVDTAAGGDNTSWAVSDEQGLLHLESMKTPDTNMICGHTLGLMREWGVSPEDILLDYGGGGKQHADRLRAMGFPVRLVAFGESVKLPRKHGLTPLARRRQGDEERYAYKNRRAELYGLLRERLNPANSPVYALPARYNNQRRADGGPSLRQQLNPIPLRYDEEGRMILIPKNKRDADDEQPTLTGLIGCSPDEADAVALSNYGLVKQSIVARAGVVMLH